MAETTERLRNIDVLLASYENPSELDEEWWKRRRLLHQMVGTLYPRIVRAEMGRIRGELIDKWGRDVERI